MAYIYDKKSHWHASKREILDNRLKKIVDGDYSDFFDYSSDFWLALCIGYFTLSYEKVWQSNDHSVHSILDTFFDENLDIKVKDAVYDLADQSGYDMEMLKKENEKLYKQIYFSMRQQVNVAGVDDSGMVSEHWADNIKKMNDCARSIGVLKEKITRNHILHSIAKLNIGKEDKINIPVSSNDKTFNDEYNLPIEWLVSYVDALCSPVRYFLDERHSSSYTSGEPVLDTLGRIYNLYTANMSLMNTILVVDDPRYIDNPNMEVPKYLKGLIGELLKGNNENKDEIYQKVKDKVDTFNIYIREKESEMQGDYQMTDLDANVIIDSIENLCAARNELEANKENVLAALLSVASINMFVINYEGYFQSKYDPSTNSDISGERENLRDFIGNGRSIPGVMGFNKVKTSASGTFRNCSAHPGRITVYFKDGEYKVNMQDRDENNDPTGSFNMKLDTCIEFLEHPFFEKNMSTSITSSDVVGVRQELEAMFDDTDKQDATTAEHSTGTKK